MPSLVVRSTVATVLLLASSAAAADPRAAHAPELRGSSSHDVRSADRRIAAPPWDATAIDAPGASADPAIAERACRDRVGSGEWSLVTNRVDGALRTVAFRQRWHGLVVDGGQVSCVFGRDRLFVVGATIRDVPTEDPGAIRADPDRAIAWLTDRVGPLDARAAGDRVVVDGRVADAIELAGPSARWTLYVGTDGTPITARNRLQFVDGTVLYDAPIRWPGDARMAYPAQTADVLLDGGATTTTVDGTVTWFTGTASTIVPSVTGTYAMVTSMLPPATGSLALPIGGTATWSHAADAAEDAELAAYVHVMIGKTTARRIEPAIATWLDQQLGVTVNEAGSCNAYSTGDSLHFFVGGPSCENTGRLADVVYHELGHAIHQHAIIPGQGAFESGLTEGMADFNATTNTGDSGVGIGFDFTATPLRELDPPGRDLRYPEDASTDPHVPGMIVAGALWDLAKLAGEPVAEVAFRGIMERAADLPSSYGAALIADDDNANLADGTPHGCAIGEAFARHGLAPDFATTTVGTPSVDGLTITLPIAIAANPTCPAPTATSATIAWHTPTGAGTVAMTAGTGSIPAQPDGTVVAYTIDVALSNGVTVRLPDNLADPEYQLFVGDATPLYCASMDADPGWTHTPGWEFGAPTGAGADPSVAATGATVFGTNLHANGDYANDAHELATLPTIDVAGFDHVHLQYRRWLAVEDALYDQATIAANGQVVWTNAQHGGTLNHFDHEWRFHDVDVTSQVADGQLAIAFGLATDSIGSSGGWTLDDVCIVGIGPQKVDPPAPAGCCGTSRPTGNLVLALGVVALVRRRRCAHDRGRCGLTKSIQARNRPRSGQPHLA